LKGYLKINFKIHQNGGNFLATLDVTNYSEERLLEEGCKANKACSPFFFYNLLPKFPIVSPFKIHWKIDINTRYFFLPVVFIYMK